MTKWCLFWAIVQILDKISHKYNKNSRHSAIIKPPKSAGKVQIEYFNGGMQVQDKCARNPDIRLAGSEDIFKMDIVAKKGWLKAGIACALALMMVVAGVTFLVIGGHTAAAQSADYGEYNAEAVYEEAAYEIEVYEEYQSEYAYAEYAYEAEGAELEDAPDAPEGGFVGIVPASTAEFTFDFGGNPYYSFPLALDGFRTVTNPPEFHFVHQDYYYEHMEGQSYNIREAVPEGYPDLIFTPGGPWSGWQEGRQILFFDGAPESVYQASVRIYNSLWGDHQTGTTLVNIQRTISFVDIQGGNVDRLNRDVSTAPGHGQEGFAPEPGRTYNESAIPANQEPVSNPTTITVGRSHPDSGVGFADTHGDMVLGSTTTDASDPYFASNWSITGPGVSVTNVPLNGENLDIDLLSDSRFQTDGVSHFIPGEIYEVRVRIQESTPDGFPAKGNIWSYSYATFTFYPPTLEKEVCSEEAEVGEVVTYTLTIDNTTNNPNDMTFADFMVRDNLDNRVTFVQDSVVVTGVSAGSYTVIAPVGTGTPPAGGVLEVEFDYLPPDFVTITFDAMMLPSAAGQTIPNTAYLFGPDRDNPLDEDDAVVVVPEPPLPPPGEQVPPQGTTPGPGAGAGTDNRPTRQPGVGPKTGDVGNADMHLLYMKIALVVVVIAICGIACVGRAEVARRKAERTIKLLH